MGAQVLTYCGGVPDIKKSGDYVVVAMPNYFEISVGLMKKVKIPYEAITSVSMKTDEQISKDVTLTRLLLLGVFAFGAKKKSKEVTNCLVIDYDCGGLPTSAIFSGKEVPKAYNDIFKSRQGFIKRNPQLASAAPAADSDIYTEIEKLHGLKEKGIITEDEFAAKKQSLLGI